MGWVRLLGPSYADPAQRVRVLPPGAVLVSSEERCPPGLVDLWREGKYCDLAVHAEGRTFHAHRVVLASGSKFIRGLLDSGLSEASDGSVTLDEMPAAAVEAVVTFLYEGTITLEDHSSVPPLLEAAAFLQAPTLQRCLVGVLIAHLVPPSCVAAWQIGTLHSETTLLAAVASVAERDALAILHSEAYAALPSAAQSEFLSFLKPHLTQRIVLKNLPTRAEGLAKRQRTVSGDREALVRDLFAGLGEFELRVQGRTATVSYTCDARFLQNSKALEYDFSISGRHDWLTHLQGEEIEQPTTGTESIQLGRKCHFTAEPGYPHELKLTDGGPSIQYWRLHVDRGVSFARAQQILAETRAAWPSQALNHGFYRSERTGSVLLVLVAPVSGAGKGASALKVGDIIVLRPSSGLAGVSGSLQYLTRRGFGLIRANNAEPAWTAAYESDTCVHGSTCEVARCTAGKRTYMMHLLTGPVLRVWPSVADQRCPLARVLVLDGDGAPWRELLGLDVAPECCPAAWELLLNMQQGSTGASSSMD